MKYQDLSPKYLMSLLQQINDEVYKQFSSYENAELYISKWQEWRGDYENQDYYNFDISYNSNQKINLLKTLNNIRDINLLFKIAADLGIQTPYFIPATPLLINELKEKKYKATDFFEKAIKEVEEHPSSAIGYANSGLESILKEILKDDNIKIDYNNKKTLYNLTQDVLTAFSLFPKKQIPQEIKTLGSSLLSINQAIESIRSNKSMFHGKTEDDILMEDKIYAYFIINVVTTIGMFLYSFYRDFYKSEEVNKVEKINEDDLPF